MRELDFWAGLERSGETFGCGGVRMAESMFVHFATATWDDLAPWLDRQAVPTGERHWRYPRGNYTLSLYEYPDLLAEYEPEELERLQSRLGRLPSLSLCIELRRSQGDRACDAAAALAVDLLRAFPGVADDGTGDGDYHSLTDLEAEPMGATGRFLDCYRVGQ